MLRHPPIIRDGVITLVGRDGNPQGPSSLQIGSSDWFLWLETVSLFTYMLDDPAGRITLRKERRSHGWYWYAYYRSNGRTRRAYLGKSANVTQQRLWLVACALLSAASPPVIRQSPPALPSPERQLAPALPLLLSKLTVPPLRASLLVLLHSFDQLQRGMQHPLTLICAPAGFGKTTLLTQWATVVRQPIAWVSLDESDNDPARFWAYVFSALERVVPEKMHGVVARLQPLSSRSVQAVLSSLINVLSTHTESLFLVIEDYHVLQDDNPTIHDGMKFLLEYLPATMHVMLTSRAAPPLPLARLRAQGKLNELGPADLHITREEASLFLTCMGISLTPADLDKLDTQIAGWITGWQLAALSLQQCQDVSGWIATFDGGHRHIADFVTEEVLSSLSQETLTFLLQTSILARLTAPLCDAVTQTGNSLMMLEQLERANLFIEPCDEQRQWYRYHPLFAAALQGHLQQTQADLVPELYRRASAWHGGHGYVVEAFEYAFKSADLIFAGNAIKASASVLLEHGGMATLRRWLDLLPEYMLYSQPHLCILKAHLLLLDGQQERMERYVQNAEEHIALVSSADLPVIQGEIKALRATIATFQGNTQQSLVLHEQALQHLPADHALRDYLMLDRGIVLQMNGKLEEAGEILETLRRQSEARGNLYCRDMSTTHLVMIRFLQGKLSDALHLYTQTQQAAISALPDESCVTVSLALYQRNDLDGAARELQRGITLNPAKFSIALAYSLLAIIREAQGEREAANAAMEQALAVTYGATNWVSAVVKANQLYLWRLQGDVMAIAIWANTQTQAAGPSEAEFPSTLKQEYEAIQRAHLHLLQGKPLETLSAIEPLLAVVLASGHVVFALQIMLLQAMAEDALGQSDRALAAMQDAITLAEPEGYLRVFLDCGVPVKHLLFRMHAQLPGKNTSFVRKILDGFGALQDGTPAQPAADAHSPIASQSLVDPLSTREVQILQLLATGASNQDLATKLVIAVGTVKRHLSNIFVKLGVQSRTQAIAQASKLQLITPAASETPEFSF